jgi:tetratricopeptide (TPR) repeat protein
MAIAYSKTGRVEEAIRAYRRALDARPHLAGAHYGLAFLLIKKGDIAGADRHLTAFLASPPAGKDGGQWIEHAQRTLDKLRNPSDESAPDDADDQEYEPEDHSPRQLPDNSRDIRDHTNEAGQ